MRLGLLLLRCLFSELSGFLARLIWWEYDWNIMEPVTYFAYLSTVIIGYTYYALIRDDYTYANLHELLTR